MKLDGVTAIALILIASFAIDRIVTATMFLLSFVVPSLDPASIESPGARARAEKLYKLVYVTTGAVLAVVVVAHYGGVRILSALGMAPDPLLDTVLTGVVLVGGSDRIAALLKLAGAPDGERAAPPPPIQITGRLTLEDSTTAKVGEKGR
jgi:hypothetical protein